MDNLNTQDQTETLTQCFHCGNDCLDEHYHYDEKDFCCIGCQSVYTILSENQLCNYYSYNTNPGKTQDSKAAHYDYLDEPKIAASLLDFSDENVSIITLYIPAIHCSSCLWLLEHLYKINPSIVNSRIDFLKKQVVITFKHKEFSLRELIGMLGAIGYEPVISLQDVVKEQNKVSDRDIIKKIAVAGFCFGNVMLLSFPEYFGMAAFEHQFKTFFGWLNLVFAIPVVFYSGRDYFISAWKNLRNKVLNLDFPLALGIAVMFIRSIYEILSGTGAGFVDTLCGLVFFLLIGKWVQQRTYHHLSFERDYRSYFPVAVTLISEGIEKPIPMDELKVGDRILIRNNEIIPADTILMKGDAVIDFSFVTGESAPVQKVLGEMVYAGGRQINEAIELEVIKPVSQSYLTSLWNNEAFEGKKKKIDTFSDTISRYFSVALLLVAFGSAAFWMFEDSAKAWQSFTAVLIIACPCALALSSPFTLSAVLSIFDKNKFYLKNTAVVEQIARINTLVFDKTGTITAPEGFRISFEGDLSHEEQCMISSLARNSGHPLSRELVKWMKINEYFTVSSYQEIPGKGIEGLVNNKMVRIGSASFINIKTEKKDTGTVYIQIGEHYAGYFSFRQRWRPGLKELFTQLGSKLNMHLLSGDQDSERDFLLPSFPWEDQMHFKQSPQDKLNYISALQQKNNKVMMLGDGLNDAGALKQSDLGIAVTDNINNFSPGCDAILDGAGFVKLPNFIQQAKDAVKVIHISFGISTIYNAVGLFFAVQGLLSPLYAAILMPLSTVTIISFTSIATHMFARKNKLT
ncbi:Cu+-exporting ATPase [Daejeonella rubra]|uniref:Cu+-exporting ATPase n=1 Tax=Daejeonella rubra TaxID=990371 RepID=A0A1G9LRQ6_9SPHI|nr:heavy metal translocating P-type ATPase metal-binding domain-containing protein [Daejeonella rubra]SDL64636.1 Cu+-exporting ATPase [Daejeonella rubra]